VRVHDRRQDQFNGFEQLGHLLVDREDEVLHGMRDKAVVAETLAV